ncbi:MAG: hypothetical protein ACI4PM_00535 [Butyricicoccus sp.]
MDQKKRSAFGGYRYEIVDDPNNEEFPKHPDKISKQPSWTDRKTFGLPVFHLYSFVFGFCIVYIGAGLIGVITNTTISHMDYLTIIGMLAGYFVGKFIIEPNFLMIPFEKGTHEQQVGAVARMMDYLGAQAEVEEYRKEKAEAEANKLDYDPSVYEDDEEVDTLPETDAEEVDVQDDETEE